MDYQAIIDELNSLSMDYRTKYHLTFGQLIDILLKAPKDATFDQRIKGVGSYRGYYRDIVLTTQDSGYTVWDGDESGNGQKIAESRTLPTNANELGKLLQSFIDKKGYFYGWKGGMFKITRNKPLWIAEELGDSGCRAVTNINRNLTLVTNELD